MIEDELLTGYILVPKGQAITFNEILEHYFFKTKKEIYDQYKPSFDLNGNLNDLLEVAKITGYKETNYDRELKADVSYIVDISEQCGARVKLSYCR